MTQTPTALNIRLFATLKDKAGKSRIEIPFEQPMAVATLLSQLTDRYPDMAEAFAISLVAVNRNYADRDLIINPGDEVALFPPVSGG